MMRGTHPQEIREIRLEGSYPETQIVVRWYDKRWKREKSRGYKLWISPVTGKPPGSFEYATWREAPYSVGMLIGVWVGES